MPDDLTEESAATGEVEQVPAQHSDPLTAELPAVEATDGGFDSDEHFGATNADGLPPGAIGYGSDFIDDDGDDEWQVRTQSKRLRMRIPTAVLVGLLIAAGAFWGGAAAQRGQGSTSSGFGAAALARLRGAAGATGATGSSGAASFFGGAGGATIGTLTEVQGSTLYLTNSSGGLVKVVLSPSTKITRTATSSASALGLGDTVIVEGSTAKNGTVTATSVSATEAGASTTGGFGGAGRGGG